MAATTLGAPGKLQRVQVQAMHKQLQDLTERMPVQTTYKSSASQLQRTQANSLRKMET